MEQGLLTQITAEIQADEGFRDIPYDDLTGKPITTLPSGGKITIGYGYNLSDRGLPRDILEDLLRRSLAEVERDAKRIFSEFEGYSRNRKAAILSLLYNLGPTRLLKFRNTIRHIRAGNWHDAARHLRASLWYRQVQKSRRDRVVQQIEQG